MKVCDKTCIFFFFLIINKYFLMAKLSLLSRCPSYVLLPTEFNSVTWHNEERREVHSFFWKGGGVKGKTKEKEHLKFKDADGV